MKKFLLTCIFTFLLLTEVFAQSLTIDFIITLERDAHNAPLCNLAWNPVTQMTDDTSIQGSVTYNLYLRPIGAPSTSATQLLKQTKATSTQVVCAAGEYTVKAFVTANEESAPSDTIRIIYSTTPNLP